MNSSPSRPDPTAAEIDRLLASRFRDTTPEFERRWVDLQRELRLGSAPRGQPHRWWRPVWWGGALVAVAGAAAALLVMLRPVTTPVGPGPAEGEFSPTFVELLEINDLLDEASPLLDAENRDALLHLPAEPSSQS